MKIGIDINVKGISIAFVTNYPKEIDFLLEILNKNREYLELDKYDIKISYETIYTEEWIGIAIAYEIQKFQYVWEYLKLIIEKWVYWHKKRKILQRLTMLSNDIVSLGYISSALGFKEMKKLLNETFKKYKLKPKIDRELADELKFIIENHLEIWKREYKKRIMLMTTRTCHIITKFSKKYETVLKLEQLKSIERKYSINEKVKLMKWKYITWLIKGGLPQRVKIGLINPRETSSTCPICKNKLKQTEKWSIKYCKFCKRKWNRDVVAAINIAQKPVIHWIR